MPPFHPAADIPRLSRSTCIFLVMLHIVWSEFDTRSEDEVFA